VNLYGRYVLCYESCLTLEVRYSSDHHRNLFDVSALNPLSFFANTTFNQTNLCIQGNSFYSSLQAFKSFFCKTLRLRNLILIKGLLTNLTKKLSFCHKLFKFSIPNFCATQCRYTFAISNFKFYLIK